MIIINIKFPLLILEKTKLNYFYFLNIINKIINNI